MSEELQSEEVNEPVDDSADLPKEGADLAPASDDQHEEKSQVDDEAAKQQAVQDAINKKTFEAKQAQRDLQAANDRLKAFEEAERKRKEAEIGQIPPPPDPYDDNYEQKVAERDQAILAKARFVSEQEAIAKQQQAAQQQQEQQHQEKIQQAAASYTAKATELGISPNELQAAGTAVLNYGISPDLAEYILQDPDGPLITKHLAANPQEGFELASMSPYAVGAYFDKVRSKVGALKPKQTNTPDPTDDLQGKGAGDQKHPALEGVIYS